MTFNYNQKLKNQFNNAKLTSQKTYYQDLYGRFANNIVASDKILEIGAGAGISSIFLPQYSITRTDKLSWDKNVEVIGGVDANNLPYANGQFDIVFGVDVLHHLNSPISAIEEISRVLKEGGRAIFIEPYVSPLSYMVYKLCHDENTTYRYDLSKNHNNLDPQEGDQGVAKALFCTKIGERMLARRITKTHSYKVRYLHPFSFFATGGLTKPINTGTMMIRILLKIETYIPQIVLKQISSRIYVELEFN